MSKNRLDRRQMIHRSALAGLYLIGGGSFFPTALGQNADEELLPWADLPDELAPGARPNVKFYDLRQASSGLTPKTDFYLLHHHEVPRLDPSSWRLTIGGRVDRPMELTLDDLLERKKTELVTCTECSGNGGYGMHGLVGNAKWGGVRLAPLLEEIGVDRNAVEVVFTGADGAEERLRGNRYPSRFARSLPLREALSENVLLAYEINGEPLSVELGFPLRLIVPGWYAVANVKWLERIEIIDTRFMGWFMAKDYVTVRGVPVGSAIEHRATSVGRAKLKSIITRVSRNLQKGLHTIHGLAWNDGSPLRTVEIQIDRRPFVAADLTHSESSYGWSAFSLAWNDPTPGPHTLASRAADAHGVQPTEEEASRYKVTPWENDGQVVRKIVLPTPR